jgi:hypothetical protein
MNNDLSFYVVVAVVNLIAVVFVYSLYLSYQEKKKKLWEKEKELGELYQEYRARYISNRQLFGIAKPVSTSPTSIKVEDNSSYLMQEILRQSTSSEDDSTPMQSYSSTSSHDSVYDYGSCSSYDSGSSSDSSSNCD